MMEMNLKTGIILGMICVVVGAGVGLGIWEAQEQKQGPSEVNVCVGHLRMIAGAKEQWGLQHQATNAPTLADLLPYMGNRMEQLEGCPEDPAHSFLTSYKINGPGTNPGCRIHPEMHRLP